MSHAVEKINPDEREEMKVSGKLPLSTVYSPEQWIGEERGNPSVVNDLVTSVENRLYHNVMPCLKGESQDVRAECHAVRVSLTVFV